MKASGFFGICLLVLMGMLSCAGRHPARTVHDVQILHSQETSLDAVRHRNEWKPIGSLWFIGLPASSASGFTYAWLRGTLTVDDPSPWHGLYLNTQNIADTVYVNGTLAGAKEMERFVVIEFSKPALYRIPSHVLRKGENEIYIRIGIYGSLKGSVRSGIELLGRDAFERKRFWTDFLYDRIFVAMILMFSSLLAVQVITYFIDRKIKIRLLQSLMILYVISLLLVLFIPFRWGYVNHAVTLFLVSIPVTTIGILILLQAIYGIFLSNVNRTFIPANLLGVLVIVLLNGNLVAQSLVVLVAAVWGFGGLGYVLYRLNAIKPRRYLLGTIIAELILMGVSTVWQLLSVPLELSVPCPDYLTMYLLFVYMFIGIVYEAMEAKRQRLRLDRLYDRLKEPASAKTTKLTITESSEEKLERVIGFINENYTSDLSREGLASAADMNPNYLSSLFNAYTGMKINDYVNGLRIRDAARQLADTDHKVIDIAFAVGFESLSTFIRAFKSETGQTPSAYREGLKG